MKKDSVEKYLSKQSQKYIAEYRKNEQAIRRDWGGTNRLLRLCSPDMKERFLQAQKLINSAINGGQKDSIKNMTSMMERAFYALITEVNERGYKHLESNVKYYEFGNRNYMIVDHDHELEHVIDRHGKEPNTLLISMEQLVKFLPTGMSDLLAKIQEFAPTAHFEKVDLVKSSKSK